MIWYFKSNQKQIAENRKEETEREREYLPGAYLCGLLQKPAQPATATPCRLPPLPGGRARARRARPRALATSCFSGHLLLPRPLLDDATERHAALALSHSLPRLILSSALSPSLPERSSSPPTPFAAATATPSLPLRIPELRPDPMELHTDARDQRRPQSTGASSSSSPVPGDRRRKFAVAEASPSSPTPPFDPL